MSEPVHALLDRVVDLAASNALLRDQLKTLREELAEERRLSYTQRYTAAYRIRVLADRADVPEHELREFLRGLDDL